MSIHEQPMDDPKFPSKSIVPMTLNPWSFMIRTSPLAAIFRHAFGWKSLRRNCGIRSVRWCVFAKYFYIQLQCWIQKMQRYLTDTLVYKIYEYIIYTYIHVHDTIYTGLQTEATKRYINGVWVVHVVFFFFKMSFWSLQFHAWKARLSIASRS